MRQLIFVMVLAAGCGKSDSSKQPPAPSTTAPAGSAAPATAPAAAPAETAAKGACTLLTVDEAAAIIGEPVEVTDGDESACVWERKARTDDHHGVAITVKTTDNAGFYDVMKQRKDAKPAEGVGDRAMTYTMGQMLVQLAVVKGSKSALIEVSDDKDNAALMQKATDAGTKIVSRM